MTTTQSSQADKPLNFSLTRVLRQAASACLFILLMAGYSASHPASYQTTTPAAAVITLPRATLNYSH